MAPVKWTDRLDYSRFVLTRAALADDPVVQFERWFKDAKGDREILDATAMCLSTVDPEGYPDARWVLLKEFDERGFVFYTNTRSMKGRSLEKTPRAALTFYWDRQERQVRIQGDVSPVSDAEAESYFATRPRLSQLGAWASQQSEPLDSNADLIKEAAAIAAQYGTGPVPRPPHWSGYRVAPRKIEFWQGRPNRLHDRFQYARQPDGAWTITRLYP